MTTATAPASSNPNDPNDPNDAAFQRLRAQNAAYALHAKYAPDDLTARQMRGWHARWERLAQEQATANGEGALDAAEATRRAEALIRQSMIKARMAGLAKQRGVASETGETIHRVQALAHPATVCPTCWREQHPRRTWPTTTSTALCDTHAAAIRQTHKTPPSSKHTKTSGHTR